MKENSKDDPELVVDNLGASMLEVQNNEKYGNVKKVVEEEEKKGLDLEELEKMMARERLGMKGGSIATPILPQLRLNMGDHIERENYPDLTDVEFYLLYTSKVSTYVAIIDNNLNKKAKITAKKTIFKIKPRE